MQERGQEFRHGEAVARARGEQARRTVHAQGEAVVGVAFDERHQAEEFDVTEKLFVAGGFVAVRGDEEIVRAVEHALRLGEVVAVEERVGRGRIEGGEHLARGQIGEQSRRRLPAR